MLTLSFQPSIHLDVHARRSMALPDVACTAAAAVSEAARIALPLEHAPGQARC